MGYTAAVVTVSDKGSRGERVDTSGPAICKMLEDAGWAIRHTSMVPDERSAIKGELVKCADELGIDLVLTTGGTGFSPRDVTPEATLEVVQRRVPGIPEAMRAASLRVTERGCLSRSEAGIRAGSLIVNLPGSEKAASENLDAVLGALEHGVQMLRSSGSADCAAGDFERVEGCSAATAPVACGGTACASGEVNASAKKPSPSMDEWLREAKADPKFAQVGMYLTHNGVVRGTARAEARHGDTSADPVVSMEFSYDQAKVDAAIADALAMDGIHYVRVWLNEGVLNVGDDIMYVLIGGDIRPRVIAGLEALVGAIKSECVSEVERF